MEPIGIALVCAFTLCIFLFAVRSVCLRVTRSKMLEDALPFTVYATIRRADDAEYIVRSVLEIDAIIRRLVQKYPFAEIGAFQTRKNVL